MHKWKKVEFSSWQKPDVKYRYANRRGYSVINFYRAQLLGIRDDDKYFYDNVFAKKRSTRIQRVAIKRKQRKRFDKYLTWEEPEQWKEDKYADE